MPRILAAGLAALLVFGSLGWLFFDGVAEPVGQRGEPVGQPGRAHVAGRRQRGRRRGRYAPERAGRELRRPGRDSSRRTPGTAGPRPTRTSSAPDCPARRSNARPPTSARSTTSWRANRRRPAGERGLRRHLDRALVRDLRRSRRRRATPTTRSPTTSSRGSTEFPEDPVVFLIGQYYGGLCNGVEDCSADTEQQLLDEATAQGVEVGPDVYVIEGDGLWTPARERRRRRASRRGRRSAEVRIAPRRVGQPPAEPARGPAARVLADRARAGSRRTGSASGTTPDRIALIPGMSS